MTYKEARILMTEKRVLFFSSFIEAYAFQVPQSEIRLHLKPNIFAREKRWVISIIVL